MIEIVEVSPNNEEAVAKRLAASIRAAWPDIASSTVDRVIIAFGLQTLREIDLFVTNELSKPPRSVRESGGTVASRRRLGSKPPRSSSK